MDTSMLFGYYEEVGHEKFLEEVKSRNLPPEIQECFDSITDCVKLLVKLDSFPVWFIMGDC